MNGGGQHVNPFIHPFISHNLCSQKTVSLFLEQNLHRHHRTAGIVTSMIHGRQINLIIRDSLLLCGLLIDSGCCNGHVEELDHRRSLGTLVMAVKAADVVRRDTALLIGGPCQ